jgi:2-oxoglutarate ferredoxin oxidoreductase subunit alpha
LPTRTQQSDVLKTAFLSHGDCRHPCFYPADVGEAYAFTHDAFDLAEAIQSPVFVLSDLDLGMNLWMSDPLPYPEGPMRRGKVLDAAGVQAAAPWGRYRDVDGDGVPYRTLPGTAGGAGAYFTRGSGHDEHARYTEDGAAYVRNMDRLARKLETARRMLPAPVAEGAGAKVGLLAYGTSHQAVGEARARLRAEAGLDVDYLRVRAWPFHDEVRAWLLSHERVYVLEQNRDAQLLRMVRMDVPEVAGRLVAVLHYDGLPLDAESVVEGILAHERAGESAATGTPAKGGAR